MLSLHLCTTQDYLPKATSLPYGLAPPTSIIIKKKPHRLPIDQSSRVHFLSPGSLFPNDSSSVRLQNNKKLPRTKISVFF